jgi:hypothetical protein
MNSSVGQEVKDHGNYRKYHGQPERVQRMIHNTSGGNIIEEDDEQYGYQQDKAN